MAKRQVDALTVKSGPAEDGLMAPAPTPTPLPTSDISTTLVVAAVVVVVAVISAVAFLWHRKKTAKAAA
jgi:hypothetical protein